MLKFPKLEVVVLFMTCLFTQSNLGGGAGMGPIPGCDDGETDLCRDWCLNAAGVQEFTCNESSHYPVDTNISCQTIDERIPPHYKADHICMNKSIEYPNPFCTFGNHRPVWPVYGTYKFMPRQRWLHACEHGAIVLLYHPCADPTELDKFKQLVTSCLRRHVISPYKSLTKERPFALFTWGHALLVSHFNKTELVSFIRTHAKNGPEHLPENGEYKLGLLQESSTVDGSDYDDSKLCPTCPQS